MIVGKKKRPRDLNLLAASIVSDAVNDNPSPDPTEEEFPPKNPAAVALGHLGGLKGGPARARKLSAKRRKQIARKAAESRWKRSKS